MTLQHRSKADPRHAEVLRRLVEGQGLRRYAFFFVTGEGRKFPNGIEESSGYVLNQDGRAYSFWTGWDDDRAVEIFTEWERVKPEQDWAGDGEYGRARQAVGLA